MDAASELAEFGDGLFQVGGRLIERPDKLRIGGSPFTQHGQREHKRHEPLLRAVMQVALNPAALPVPRLDDALPRRAHLIELRTQVRVQSLVL